MSTIEELEKIGFINVGNWRLSENNKIDYNLQEDKSKEILYSFVIKDKNTNQIIYIGKTIKTLIDRMKGYKKPGPTQNTNIRINEIIKEFLINGYEVFIYRFKQNEELFFKDLKINLAAGLEDNLIRKFKPKYNLHGNSKIVEEVEIDENNITLQYKSTSENNCYTGLKRASNSNLTGIINLSFIPQKFLPEFGVIVTVHLDNIMFESNFTNGNNNGQYDPRINSSLIGNWLNERIKVGDNFYVKICNNNTFYFYTNVQ